MFGDVRTTTLVSKAPWFKKGAHTSVFVTLYMSAFAEPEGRASLSHGERVEASRRSASTAALRRG